MVAQAQIRASNALIPTSLPKGLTAVFVGGTSGIGEYTLIQFAKHTAGLEPVVYFIGRSQQAADRITKECNELCPDGKFTFIQADTSLLKNVDNVCRRLKKELEGENRALNLLWLSTGTLVFKEKTSEDINLAVALFHYGRARFILNLLPLIKKAQGLRRVVSCFTGTKEGPVDTSDIQREKTSITTIASARGQGASLVTLSMEHIAKSAPEVSFIHDFPGPVKSGIARDTTGIFWSFIKVMFAVTGPFVYIPNVDSGERHLYLCTSSRYPAALKVKDGNDVKVEGVPCPTEITVAIGTDGETGSGAYVVDEVCESGKQSVVDLLRTMRQYGTSEKVWNDLEEQFMRVTGTKVIT